MKKLLLLLTITNILYAKLSLNLINKDDFNLAVTLNSKQQTDNTDIKITDTNFSMDESFDYSRHFMQITLDGNVKNIAYKFDYAKSSGDSMEKLHLTYSENRGFKYIDNFAYTYTNNTNTYTDTVEHRFAYFSLLQWYYKDYTIKTNNKIVKFIVSGYEFSTKEFFNSYVKIKAQRGENFNYILAFAYKNNNFLMYANPYYSFDFSSLSDLTYKDNTQSVEQTTTIDLIGMRYGYYLTLQYNTGNIQYMLKADYNIEELSKDATILQNTSIDYTQKVIDIYASIKYVF